MILQYLHISVKRFYLIMLLLFFASCLQAQNSIEGYFTLPTTGTVYIRSLNTRVDSDSSGYFQINNLPRGMYVLELSSAGYQSKLVTIQLTQEAEHFKVEPFQLVPNHIVINDVVVTGTRTSQQLNQILPTERVNASEMYSKGKLSIMETLADKPGITLITTGPGIARPVIRGLSSNRIVTVLNGVKLENQQWDLEHTLGLNQYGIDRVEIIKGPASFLYGSDAIGGVIQFVDDKPAPLGKIVGDVVAGFNSNTFGSVSGITLKGAKNKYNWGVYAGLNNNSDYYDANFDRVANSRFREFLGKTTFGIQQKKSTTLLSYQLNIGYYGIVEPFESDSAGKEEEEDHPMEFETPYHTYQHHTALAKNTLQLNRVKLITTLSYQHDNRKELEPGTTEENPYIAMSLNTGHADVKTEYAITSNMTLITGVQSTLQQNQNGGTKYLIPDYTQIEYAGYFIHQIQSAQKRFKFDWGMRYDARNYSSLTYGVLATPDYMPALDKSFNNLSASAGLNYAVTSDLNVYANIGTGYRAPNMAELTSNGFRPETQRYEKGDTKLNKENNIQGDVGFSYSGSHWSVQTNVFYNQVQNFIYIQRSTDSISNFPVYYYKQNDATLYGGEFSLGIQPEWLRNITYTGSMSVLQAKQSTGEWLPMMPPYKLNNELTWSKEQFKAIHSPSIRVAYQYNWEQNRVAENELTTPAYGLVNLSTGGEISILKQTVRIWVGVNNLLNQKYYDHLSRLRVYGVYNTGINAFINVQVPLSFKYN